VSWDVVLRTIRRIHEGRALLRTIRGQGPIAFGLDVICMRPVEDRRAV
jgi:hypothetical protein